MRHLIIMAAFVLAVSGCAAAGSTPAGQGTDRAEAVPSSEVTDSTSSPDPSLPAATQDASTFDRPGASFEWVVTEVNDSNRAELASTWRPDCPVALEDLRLVELTHWDYSGESVRGRMVIHRDRVDDVETVFARLYEARFPIEQMELIDAYDGDDNASMAANNSSAFNCREIAGSPGVWSEHASGGAIDLNPLVNPWIRGATVEPPGGEQYVDRDQDVPGLIKAGDVVTEAFAEVGWIWGGTWAATKDYQHFSWNGR